MTAFNLNANIENKYEYANKIYQENKFKTAVNLYLDIIRNCKKEIQCNLIRFNSKFNLSMALKELGFYHDSYSILKELKKERPYDESIKLMLSKVAIALMDNINALNILTEIINSKRNVSSAYGLRGEVYFLKNDHTRALSDFKKALELEPNNLMYLIFLSSIYADRTSRHFDNKKAYTIAYDAYNIDSVFYNQLSLLATMSTFPNSRDREKVLHRMKFLTSRMKDASKKENFIAGLIYLRCDKLEKAIYYFEQSLPHYAHYILGSNEILEASTFIPIEDLRLKAENYILEGNKANL